MRFHRRGLPSTACMRGGEPYVILDIQPVDVTVRGQQIQDAMRKLRAVGFDVEMDGPADLRVRPHVSGGDWTSFMAAPLVAFLAAEGSERAIRTGIEDTIAMVHNRIDDLKVRFDAVCGCGRRAQVTVVDAVGKTVICGERGERVPWIVRRGRRDGRCPHCIAEAIERGV